MNKNEQMSHSSDTDVDEEIEVVDSVTAGNAPAPVVDDWCTPPGGDSNISTVVEFTGTSISRSFQSNLFPGPPTKKAKLDRSDSDEYDKSDSTSDATSHVDVASGWGDGNTLFGGVGWGRKTPDLIDEKDVSWEPPREKGICFNFFFFEF